MYAIELYFDDLLECEVRSLWQLVAQAAPSDTLQRVAHARPHISLAVCDDARVEDLCAVVEALDDKTFPIHFSVIGCFPPSGTLFLGPAWSVPLAAMHEKTAHHLRQRGVPILSYYEPGHWSPHATIGLELSPDALTNAFDTVIRQFTSLKGWVTHVGAVEVIYEGRRHVNTRSVFSKELAPWQ
ncbi:MAG: 2'-5' RNA ligase family protein [Firmicutes bacterium]|nr:2'-5' RNA ligase family protein [Bacillota bacterium]